METLLGSDEKQPRSQDLPWERGQTISKSTGMVPWGILKLRI